MNVTHVFYALIPHLILPAILDSRFARSRSTIGVLLALAFLAVTLFVPLVTYDNWMTLSLEIVLVMIVNVTTIRTIKNGFLARTLLLLFHVISVAVVFGSVSLIKGFNRSTVEIISRIRSANVLASGLDARDIHIGVLMIAGLITATFEINNPIAFILKRAKLMPDDKATDDHGSAGLEGEPARGRAIGYLERAIVFVLTVNNNLPALGLVLVAKGIARFRQMDDRDFAEYVLIGTLLSIVAAMVIGFAVRGFL